MLDRAVRMVPLAVLLALAGCSDGSDDVSGTPDHLMDAGPPDCRGRLRCDGNV